MPRIRTIKPEFFQHHALYQAEKESKLPLRIAFSALWCQADREGRFKWRPNELKLGCLPYDELDFSRVLDALETRGFILKYASGTLGWIPGFKKHQIINNKESDSLIPQPKQEEIDAWSTRDSRVTVLEILDQGERKGKERKGKELISISASNEAWLKFWSIWKKKTAKQPAFKVFQKINPDQQLLEVILKAVEIQQNNVSEIKFMPNPDKWLRNNLWEDEVVQNQPAKRVLIQ